MAKLSGSFAGLAFSMTRLTFLQKIFRDRDLDARVGCGDVRACARPLCGGMWRSMPSMSTRAMSARKCRSEWSEVWKMK